MNYEVFWTTELLDRLAIIYVAFPLADQDRIANGVEHLNRRLAQDPLDVGESRSHAERVVFLPFLMITFRIDPVKRKVRILNLVRYGR